MAKPIRERGIRWVETYGGDKSAHLKEEMDKQIGPGAYMRWEGHDVTTNTDYYVVISPGYSKKKGFHFFAGLRKMPADHGASGKKFHTQRQAMAYARQMWRVPPPKIKPQKPGGYGVEDLVDKPIIMESQHKGAASEDRGLGTRLAMAVQTLGHSSIHESYSPYVVADRLCWAHKASPVLGFMPALYSKARFIVPDLHDQPSGERGKNEYTGQVEDLPPAPIIATYQQPSQQLFNSVVNDGVVVHNDLVKVDRKGGKPTGFQYLPKFSEKPDRNYSQTTWRDMKVTPTIIVPPTALHNSRPLWSSLKALTVKGKGGGEEPAVQLSKEFDEFATTGNLPRRVYDKLQSFNDPVHVGVSVSAQAFPQVRQLAEQARCLVEVKKGEQQDLVDLIAMQGDKFDWDQPYFESIRLAGSQLLVYNHGIPNRLMANESRRTDQESDLKSGETKSKGYFFFMLKDPYALVSQYASEDLAALGALVELKDFLSAPQPPASSRQQHRQWQVRAQRAADIARSMGIVPDATPEGLPAAAGELKPVIDESIGEFVGAFRQALEAGSPPRDEAHAAKLAEIGRRYDAARTEVENTWKRTEVPKKKAALDAIQSEMSHYMSGFRALAEHGLVRLTPDMFVDSRTCAPKLIDYHMETYDVERFMIPMSGGRINKNIQEKMDQVFQPYAPDFELEAPQQPDGTRAARRWDPETNGIVYGPLPQGAQPKQGSSTGLRGVRSLIAKGYATMSIAKPGGGTHVITAGEMGEYRTAPGPNGPEFMTGGLYDVIVSPEKSSPRGSDVAMHKTGMGRVGFVLMTQDHSVENRDGVVKTRQHASTPFTGKNPEEERNKDFYKANDGTDLSEFAFKKGSNVMFTSTEAIRLFLEKQMGLKDEDLGPFTPLTMQDLRIIDHYATDGIRYYLGVEKYNEAVRGNNTELVDPQGVPVPPGPHDNFDAQLVREGYENLKSLDQQKYDYGKVCYECTGKKLISPQTFKSVLGEFQQAIENPAEAFKPKQIDLYGLLYLEQEAEGGPEDLAWLKDKDGTDLVFGTKAAAQEFLMHSTAKDREGIHVETYVEKATFPFSLHIAREIAGEQGMDPEAIQMTRNKDMFVDHVQALKAQEADFEASEAPVPDAPAQPIPSPAQPEQPSQPLPGQPQPAAQPGQPVQPGQPQRPPVPPARAGGIARLVALANRLDSMGRTEEADAVDRLIRRVGEESACPA